MPNCPRCNKPVYFAERKFSLGKDWHNFCLKCQKCNRTLTPGSHAEHDGQPYCSVPCYAALFGPKGYGHGGTESHTFKGVNDASGGTAPATPAATTNGTK